MRSFSCYPILFDDIEDPVGNSNVVSSSFVVVMNCGIGEPATPRGSCCPLEISVVFDPWWNSCRKRVGNDYWKHEVLTVLVLFDQDSRVFVALDPARLAEKTFRQESP